MAKLAEQVREVIRIKHYGIRTEHAYLGSVLRNAVKRAVRASGITKPATS